LATACAQAALRGPETSLGAGPPWRQRPAKTIFTHPLGPRPGRREKKNSKH